MVQTMGVGELVLTVGTCLWRALLSYCNPNHHCQRSDLLSILANHRPKRNPAPGPAKVRVKVRVGVRVRFDRFSRQSI